MVAQDGTLSVQDGSVKDSFGFDWRSKAVLGMGLSTDAHRLQRNISEVAKLNSNLREHLLNISPSTLDDVIKYAKHINETGKTSNIRCSMCCFDLVRSDAVHNYNDLLEEANDISSRYLNIFEQLQNMGASDAEICHIMHLCVRRDETIVSRPDEFVSTDDFVHGLREIVAGGHNIPLTNWVEDQIAFDAANLSKYDEQLKSFDIPVRKLALSCHKVQRYITILHPIADLKFKGRDVTQAMITDYLKRYAATTTITAAEIAECKKLLLCETSIELVNVFDELMKEAKEVSDGV